MVHYVLLLLSCFSVTGLITLSIKIIIQTLSLKHQSAFNSKVIIIFMCLCIAVSGYRCVRVSLCPGIAADIFNGFSEHINPDSIIQRLWNTTRITCDNIVQLNYKSIRMWQCLVQITVLQSLGMHEPHKTHHAVSLL